MWVVKLGGSLNANPRLVAWLRALADLGGGRVAIVAGGGGFADVAREVQAQWRIDEVAAHNMAVLAMVQSAYLLRALEPRLVMAMTEDEVRAALRRGQTALWLPYAALRDQLDDTTTWEVTSDSLALQFAKRLHAERLVVVKCCHVDRRLDVAALVREGVLDARFALWTRDADFEIDVVNDELIDEVKQRLLGVRVHGSPPQARRQHLP
jgi:5-(aminomethyl)-3-furanmethanol phosphate kinase